MMISSLLVAVSPFIANVYEYNPAPGQFVNLLPEYEEGDTYDDMLAKASAELCGEAMPGMITLGAFGGYVVFGFDHPVVNVEGQPDINIYGNAVSNGAEPGIISVSVDINGNGLPDDPWYELAGSAEGMAELYPAYALTYFAPEEGHEPVKHPDFSFVTDAQYCRWGGEGGATGFIMTTTAHDQPYWPMWLGGEVDRMHFHATMLPPNAEALNDKGTNYRLTPYDWGYVDNLPNAQVAGFDLGNAIDIETRQPVALTHADFFKVHTALNQSAGWLGETSTEVTGAEDLHPDAEMSGVGSVCGDVSGWRLRVRPDGAFTVAAECPMRLTVVAMDGRVTGVVELSEGVNTPDFSGMGKGMHLLTGNGKSLKIIL